MQRERRRALPSPLARLGVALGLVALVACGDDSPGTPQQTITVSAATSLTAAFTEIGEAFTEGEVRFNFGASSALADGIVAGAPADVFASADQIGIAKLQTAKRITGNPRTFAHNTLTIVVKPGNPSGVTRLASLPGVGVVSLCAFEVPCGVYAGQALASAKVRVDESRVTRGQNVAATLDAVAEGDAVAGIVYVTDARAKTEQVDTVAIPDTENVIAAYPIAALRGERSDIANKFVAFVAGKTGQRILKKYGFLP